MRTVQILGILMMDISNLVVLFTGFHRDLHYNESHFVCKLRLDVFISNICSRHSIMRKYCTIAALTISGLLLGTSVVQAQTANSNQNSSVGDNSNGNTNAQTNQNNNLSNGGQNNSQQFNNIYPNIPLSPVIQKPSQY